MDNAFGPTALAIIAIWSVVFLGYFIWYLWSLSRLFPKLGLPAWAGWVPVWNIWQLIQRGGLPGWLVLLGLIPGLGIVVLVVLIIAMNRINAEHGKGGGFTVLGVVLPPLWAMLLTSHIGHGEVAPAPVASGIPGFAPRAPQQASVPQPGGQWQGLPPVQPEALNQPQTFAPPPPPVSAPAPAPLQSFAPPALPAVPVAPGQPMPPAFPPPSADQLLDPEQDVPPLVVPDSIWNESAPQVAVPAPPQVPAAPQAPADTWGFGSTTEGAFERLAEEAQRAGNGPLGAAQPQQPFSWPEPAPDSQPLVLPAPPVQNAPPAPYVPVPEVQTPEVQLPVVPPVPPAPAYPPAEPVVVAPPASVPPESVPPVSVPPVVAPPIPDPFTVPEPDPVPSIFDTGSAPVPAAPAVSGLAELGLAAPEADESAAVAAAHGAPEEELDRTVVVVRKTRWGLELPDGDVLELLGDDVIVGRKPSAQAGAIVLQIADPTRTMSKTHARLRRDGDSWTIEDLNSTNGVAVIDALGLTNQIDAGEVVEATERLLVGTLEVRLRTIE